MVGTSVPLDDSADVDGSVVAPVEGRDVCEG